MSLIVNVDADPSLGDKKIDHKTMFEVFDDSWTNFFEATKSNTNYLFITTFIVAIIAFSTNFLTSIFGEYEMLAKIFLGVVVLAIYFFTTFFT